MEIFIKCLDNFKTTDAIEKYAKQKFGKIKKYGLDSNNVEMIISLGYNNKKATVKCIAKNIYGNDYFALKEGSELYEVIDQCSDVLIRQIRKQKESFKKKRNCQEGGEKDE